MMHSDDPFGLAVVIPVWNDPEGLAGLLPQLLARPEVTQIIVSDDASDPPCTPQAIGLPETAAADPRLLWLRSENQRGAGHARNIGLEQVTAQHVLFFDSDDTLLPGFADLIADLADPGTPRFDFCLFRHVDSRQRARGTLAPLASDQHHWDTIDVPEAPTPLSPKQAARICRISAYPWNKIYRTDFLRAHKVRCTEIMVHNDLELHWTGFLRARHILASSRLCCEHFVHESGRRLTNRSGTERLEVFRALEAVQADIASSADIATTYADAAAEFYLNLFRWIDGMLEPGLRAPFHDKARSFLRQRLSVPVFTLIATRDPALARRLNHFLARPAP